jgi:precorrin-6A/cobalt-precorrin-6A reductase
MTQIKVLILGGSTESAKLARTIATDQRFAATLSLAGRTEHPARTPVPMRSGGFGGADGLVHYLAEKDIDALIDATHPFAAHMKQNAVEAARMTGVAFLAIRRPAWAPEPGDHWTEIASLEEAATALGEAPRRVLLTTGRKELAPFKRASQHFYLVRSVEPPDPEALPPRAEVISARGPFTVAGEKALLEEQGIEIIVTKNSGGTATSAKLEAARALSLPVLMVRRPALPDAPSAETVEEALLWLERHHEAATSTRRGV